MLSKKINPLLPKEMLSQDAVNEILKVDPMYFGLDAKGVEQQRQNIKKNIHLGSSTAQPNSMAQTSIPRSMPMNMPTIEEPEQDSTNFLGSLLAQGTAMLGAGIQGGDVAQVGRSFEAGRQRAEQDRKAKALVDPNSAESKRRRMVFEKALDFKIPEEYSATDLNDPIVLQSIRDKKMQELAPKGGVVGQAKPEKESKDQKETDVFTSNAENLKTNLEKYRKLIKEIKSPIGYASEKAKAESLANSLLLQIKVAENTGSLDQGSIEIIKGLTGDVGYTRNDVIDSKINQTIDSLNSKVESKVRGLGTKNKFYKPYIPSITDPKEKAIIENYYSDPNDPDNLNLYQVLKAKKGF